MARNLTSNPSDVSPFAVTPFAVSPFAGALALVLAACGGAGSLESATEMPKTPRRPDGVALEPPAALPEPVDRGAPKAVIALREPLADKDVEEVVRVYVNAFTREDVETLTQLLSPDAVPLGRAGGRQQLVEAWKTKIRNFEYQKLAGAEVARVSQMVKRTFEGFGGPDAPARPQEMRPGDLYVRIPIVTPRVGTEQLFGDVLVLLLRREEGHLRIAGQADENTP